MDYEEYINEAQQNYAIHSNCIGDITSIETTMTNLRNNLLLLKNMPKFIEHASNDKKNYFDDKLDKINEYLEG